MQSMVDDLKKIRQMKDTERRQVAPALSNYVVSLGRTLLRHVRDTVFSGESKGLEDLWLDRVNAKPAFIVPDMFVGDIIRLHRETGLGEMQHITQMLAGGGVASMCNFPVREDDRRVLPLHYGDGFLLGFEFRSVNEEDGSMDWLQYVINEHGEIMSRLAVKEDK